MTCELKIKRLRREEQEAGEDRRQARARREEWRRARERALQSRNEAQARRREERRASWKAFWENRRKRREQLGGVTGTLTVLLALGLPTTLALLIYAFAVSPAEGDAAIDKWEVLGIGLLTAAAAFAVGALLGFLFGIPRSTTAPVVADVSKDPSADEGRKAPVRHFATNTNLEQISDWLTKILVGVGLVQIHQISGAVEDLAEGLAPGLGPQGNSVAVALLVAFPVIGFVSAYLYTRLRLQGAFEAALLSRLVEERANKETGALALVQQQLTPGVDKPKLDELIAALKAATSGVREQAFFLARRQSLENWANEGDDEERRKFEALSAPVFEALIACDTKRQYHRPRAELGYVLLRKPDYAAAKVAFDEAIEIRPPHLLARTPRYEFNRAYCEIQLDPNFKNKRASEDPVVDAVCLNLEAVVDLLKSVEAEKHAVVEEWLTLNSANARVSALREKFKKVGSDSKG